jgi:hypothetical protein
MMVNSKSALKGEEIKTHLAEVSQRNNLHFELTGLTKPTREILNEVITSLLDRIGANPLASFHLFSGLMEALLNGVKGNVRHVIFQDEILQKLIKDRETQESEVDDLMSIILDTSPLRDAMARYVVPEKLKKTVQKVLTLQDKFRVKKESLSPADVEFLKEARIKLKRSNLKISMKIKISDEELYIRIRNDAPIHSKDIARIEASRDRHKKLADQGKSAEYFRPDHLDETESAGFGIAMIDEGFYNMGINPLEYFTIVTSPRNTTVYMRYPLEDLRKMDF